VEPRRHSRLLRMRADADVVRGPGDLTSARRRDADPAAAAIPTPAAVPAMRRDDTELQDQVVTHQRF
jgi:hypothetical protein